MILMETQPLPRERVILRLDLTQICCYVNSWQDCGVWAGSKWQFCVAVTEMWLPAVTPPVTAELRPLVTLWIQCGWMQDAV